MRFQKGIGYPHPRRPRGPGRGDPPYGMSRVAYQTRLSNLVAWHRPRTHEQTQRIQIEIALATHRTESYRMIARRLGLKSHAYCWRVAHDYRRGLLQLLPRDEQGLVALRDSLGVGEAAPSNSFADTALARPARASIAGGGVRGGMSRSPATEPRALSADEWTAQIRREAEEWKQKNPRFSRRVVRRVPVR